MSLKIGFIVLVFASALAMVPFLDLVSLDAVTEGVVAEGIVSESTAAKGDFVVEDDDEPQFKVKFAGQFSIQPESGKPFRLSIKETGRGNAPEFGEFTYNGSAIQDFSNVPQRCQSGMGHTAIEGMAVFSFKDGDMIISREKGTACLDFTNPNITRIIIHEEWRIIPGGNGGFEKATGKLTRTVDVYLDKPHPGPFPLETTFTGAVKFGSDNNIARNSKG